MRWALAAVALVLGALAPFAGSPYGQGDVSAAELAHWIKDRKPGLRVIDLRSQKDFDAFHIPTSVRAAPKSIDARPDETIVLVSDGDVSSEHPNVYVLRGGVRAWTAEVANRRSEAGRYFGGIRRGGC